MAAYITVGSGRRGLGDSSSDIRGEWMFMLFPGGVYNVYMALENMRRCYRDAGFSYPIEGTKNMI